MKSPLNEPLNEVADTVVKPAKLAAVAPKATVVDPRITLLFVSIVLLTPPAFTLKVSVLISIDVSSTFTDKAVPAPPDKPAPATEDAI